jgi:filamin
MLNGSHIKGSPFACHVFDPAEVDVRGLDVGIVGQELAFEIDARNAGHGQPQVEHPVTEIVEHNCVQVHIIHHGRSIHAHVREKTAAGLYECRFVPDGPGQYKIHVNYNELEVKGE